MITARGWTFRLARARIARVPPDFGSHHVAHEECPQEKAKAVRLHVSVSRGFTLDKHGDEGSKGHDSFKAEGRGRRLICGFHVWNIYFGTLVGSRSQLLEGCSPCLAFLVAVA